MPVSPPARLPRPKLYEDFMTDYSIGVIGCGNISSAYFRLGPSFRRLNFTACADINPDAAKAQAEKFDLKPMSIEDLLADPSIDIVVNLTIPDAHFGVSKQILEAGKHAYSEKPFVLTLEEGEELRGLAEKHGLRVGSAPDTFLGGAHQQARAHIDSGAAGTVTSGTAVVMGHGMEHWHPNPDFFFLPGAGPVLDLGPYYVTNLINLVGPIKRVGALTSMAQKTRIIKSEPRRGEELPVKTPTNIHALLEFQSGATITMLTSWDVWAHTHSNMELYGTGGSVYVPDPNFFGGTVEAGGGDQAPMAPLDAWEHPFGIPNEDHGPNKMANYRGAGLADMARAIDEGGPHRCSLEVALHAVDVMTSVLRSGDTGQFETLATTCDRPAPLTPDEATALLR